MTPAGRTDRVVRIGNGQGFWGDSARGPAQLVRSGELDYLTMDYLAEVTMSILQKMRARDPKTGYATDFVRQVEQILPDCHRQGVRIVANAGGVNPQQCAEAVREVAERLRLPVRVAIVTGDDLLPDLPALLQAGHELANLDTGAPLRDQLDRVRSANAYLGAFPIARALDEGADIVVTGRVTDASLTLGPLIHEFGWTEQDLDLLAAGTVAGHLLECGTQVTGGNHDRWQEIPDLARIGFPLVEFHPDGRFVVTKPDGTGGLVDRGTVTAQLLYEIGDPAAYQGPDVVTDFTSVRLADVGPDRVEVTGVVGRPPTDRYKVSIGLQDGWRTVAQLTVGGPQAVGKARLTAQILFDRLEQDGVTFPPRDVAVELLGTGALYPGMPADPADDPSAPAVTTSAAEPAEVVLRIAVRSAQRGPGERLGQELASLLTSGPPGLTGFAGGRPRPSEVVAFWPALVDKSAVTARVGLLQEAR